jgi:hypothetical protein
MFVDSQTKGHEVGTMVRMGAMRDSLIRKGTIWTILVPTSMVPALSIAHRQVIRELNSTWLDAVASTSVRTNCANTIGPTVCGH